MLNFLLKVFAPCAKSNMLCHHGAQFKICGGDVAFKEKTTFCKKGKYSSSQLSMFLFIQIIITFNIQLINVEFLA